MLNFNHLYYFHIVASEGSVKGAADRLGVTQPTVSEQVRMLERALGVDLFERTSTGLRLTHSGRDAFQHTTAMFLAGERLVEALGQSTDPPGVTLRIGMSAGVARTIAADFLMPVLTVEHCRPSIRTGEFNEMLRAVRSNELDLLISEAEPVDVNRTGLAVEVIYKPTLVAIALPDIDPRPDWKNLSLIEYRPSSAYHWAVGAYLDEQGLRPTIVGEVDDAFLMLEAVLRGGFVAFVPKSVARDALRRGLAKVLAHISPEPAGVYAIYPAADTLELARTAVGKLIENARTSFEDT